MIVMAALALLLLLGIALTLRWGGTAYATWEPEVDPDGVRATVLRYLRGVAIALVAGFWAGALVTGPAVRLIMRLLAVTAGDDAQGRTTEADEVVGRIDLGGTLGLYVFGGLLPGLLSGAIYVVMRRWLPSGRIGGVAFGALHLVIAATRIDPLRPDNPDFDLVGPGWLAVATFGAASVFHGMAVVALANRYSSSFPPRTRTAAGRARVLLPLVPPALLLLLGIALLVPVVLGLAITVAASQVPPVMRGVRSRAALLAGRIALSIVAVALLPGAVIDVRNVVVRDDHAAGYSVTAVEPAWASLDTARAVGSFAGTAWVPAGSS